MEKTTVFIVAGPSAGGKTAISDYLVKNDSRFSYLKSGTARPKRGDNFDDEYIYFTEETFMQAVERGEFVEYARYAGNLYGTLYSEIERVTKEGKTPLLVLELNGIKAFLDNPKFDVFATYVYTDINTLESRLYDRYLKENPNVDGLKKYAERRDQNIGDYLKLVDYTDYFYSFVDNNGALDDTVKSVLDSFNDFQNNKPKDVENSKSVAAKLKEMAEEKFR